MFSDGLRLPLWKGYSTPKGVGIHRLKTTDLGWNLSGTKIKNNRKELCAGLKSKIYWALHLWPPYVRWRRSVPISQGLENRIHVWSRIGHSKLLIKFTLVKFQSLPAIHKPLIFFLLLCPNWLRIAVTQSLCEWVLREFVFYYVSPRIKSRSSGLTACGPHLYLLGVHPFPFPRIVRYHQASDHAEFRQMQVLICSALLIILPGTCPTSTLSPGITTTIQREPVLLRMLSLQRLLLTLLVFPCSKWKWWQWALFGLIVELDQDPLCPSSTFTSCILSSAIRTECSVVYKTKSPCCRPGERSIYQLQVQQRNVWHCERNWLLQDYLSSNIHVYSCPNKHVYMCICTHTMPLFVWNKSAFPQCIC